MKNLFFLFLSLIFGSGITLSQSLDFTATYVEVDFSKHLRKKEGFPVKYISLHNEGEDWQRWPADGKNSNIGQGHDYNMFWPPNQVIEFINLMTPMLRDAGLNHVWIKNGESTSWYRFSTWGYAEAIYDNEEALDNMNIMTSHGFYSGSYGRWFGDYFLGILRLAIVRLFRLIKVLF